MSILEQFGLTPKVITLLFMIFFHIVDDYYLQGILASMKQKDWWNKNAPDKMYKNDYVIALFMHSFSWSFSIHLPIFIYILMYGGKSFYVTLFILNIGVHMVVDDLKANKKKINLIADQSIHLMQIIATWFIYLF